MSTEISKFEVSSSVKQPNGQIKRVSYEGQGLLQLGIPNGQFKYVSALWPTYLPVADALGEIVGSYVTLRRNLSIPKGISAWPELQNGNSRSEPCSVEFFEGADLEGNSVAAYSPYLEPGERLEDLPVQLKQAQLPEDFDIVWIRTPYSNYRFRGNKAGKGVVTMITKYFTPMEMSKLFFSTTGADIPQDISGLARILESQMIDLPKLPYLH